MYLIDYLAKYAKEEKIKLDEEKKNKETADQHHHNSLVTNNKEQHPNFISATCKRKRTSREVTKVARHAQETQPVEEFNEIDDNNSDGQYPRHDENWRRERELKKPMVYNNNNVKRMEVEKRVKTKEVEGTSNGAVIRETYKEESVRIIYEEFDDDEPYEGKNSIKKHKEEGGTSKGIVIRERNSKEFMQKRKKNEIKKGSSDGGLNNKNKKKGVYEYEGTIPPSELSVEFKNRIYEKAKQKGGIFDNEEILVIQKALTESDVKRQQNRFLIPVNKVANQFLNADEEAYLDVKLDGKRYNYNTVDIIEPSGEVESVELRKWKMDKANKASKTSVSYVMNGNWKNVVSDNQLQAGDVVQLWALRISGELCFAFVILERRNTSAAASARDNSDEFKPSTSATAPADHLID